MGVVLITGCRSGFGYETALAFGRRGDVVHATMRDPSRGDRLRDAAAVESLDVRIGGLDVTDADACRSVVGAIVAEHGRLDVLVNNAGIPGRIGAFEDLAEDAVRAVFETNFWGTLRLCQLALPIMRGTGSGVIVNISSFGARLEGGALLGPYALTKHLVSNLSVALDTEAGPYGVRTVAIEPGFFATDIYDASDTPAVPAGSPYADRVVAFHAAVGEGIRQGADPAVVARAIVAAVDDPSTPSRVLVGDDAVAMVDQYVRAQYEAWQQRPTAH